MDRLVFATIYTKMLRLTADCCSLVLCLFLKYPPLLNECDAPHSSKEYRAEFLSLGTSFQNGLSSRLGAHLQQLLSRQVEESTSTTPTTSVSRTTLSPQARIKQRAPSQSNSSSSLYDFHSIPLHSTPDPPINPQARRYS